MGERLLTLMRGLSGSGKSKKATELAERSGGLVISTDDYWYDDKGNYNFDYDKIGDAHSQAQWRARDNMATGEPHVIIDNTNARWWEMFPYLEMAREHDYSINVYMVGGCGPEDIALYAARNIHGTPIAIIERQAKNFELMMDPAAGYHLEKLRRSIEETLKKG